MAGEAAMVAASPAAGVGAGVAVSEAANAGMGLAWLLALVPAGAKLIWGSSVG